MALELTVRSKAPIPLEVNMRVEPGELLALVGHSGAGKTTLLRTIAGLWRPDTARVAVAGTTWVDTAAGVDLPPHRRRLGYVFQSYALFPHMTASENVSAALPHLSRSKRAAEAQRLLDLVHLTNHANRRPATLSGGEQQRVAIARALARRPHVLLLDEPFSAVDRASREGLYKEILSLRRLLSMPVVLVTHDMNEAQLLADRILVLERGREIAEGSTAAVMSDPDALRAMGIREVAALLPARIAAQEVDHMTRLDTGAGPIWLPRIEGPVGSRVRVRILAQEVILARGRPEGLSAQNILPGTVVEIRERDGPAVLVRLSIGDDEVVARITQRAANALALKPGDSVHAIIKAMTVARDHVLADVTEGEAW